MGDAWNLIPQEGNPYVVLDAKLRAMTKSLKKWSDRWIGNVKLQIGIAMEIIYQLDKAMDTRTLTDQESALRQLLKQKLLGLCSLERTIARQRSRILFLREGDAKTSFFHQSACHRQRRNMLTMIQHGDTIASGQEEIANEVDEYFSNVFGEAPTRALSVDLSLLHMPVRDLSHLEAPFTEEEVERIVKAMPPDKAPGPDGFSCRFYASCWRIIKGDFMRALEAFYHGDMRGIPSINKAIVTLLPMLYGAVDIKDFRPLSLVHGVIKLFDKILSTRLVVELPSLVGNHQSAFVKGWSIHYNFMLV